MIRTSLRYGPDAGADVEFKIGRNTMSKALVENLDHMQA